MPPRFCAAAFQQACCFDIFSWIAANILRHGKENALVGAKRPWVLLKETSPGRIRQNLFCSVLLRFVSIGNKHTISSDVSPNEGYLGIVWCLQLGYPCRCAAHLHHQLQFSPKVTTNAKNFGPPVFNKMNYLRCLLWSQTLLVPTVLVLSVCNTYL